jgi:lysophospholipase L1-like esterase
MAMFRVCFVGDSITLGTADEELMGWPGRLCRRAWSDGHDVTLYNLGIRADTSALIQQRWRVECAARLPDHAQGRLVFAFGVNDTAVEQTGAIRVPQDRSLANARAILTDAKAWKPVLWIGPAPVRRTGQRVSPAPGVSYDFHNDRIAALDRAYAALATEIGIPYLATFPRLIDDEAWHAAIAAGDGVHAAGVGYAMIARLVAGWDAWQAWLRG